MRIVHTSIPLLAQDADVPDWEEGAESGLRPLEDVAGELGDFLGQHQAHVLVCWKRDETLCVLAQCARDEPVVLGDDQEEAAWAGPKTPEKLITPARTSRNQRRKDWPPPRRKR